MFEDAYDVAFPEAKRSECQAVWEMGFIDFVTLEGGGIMCAIIHVTSSIKEEFEPIR